MTSNIRNNFVQAYYEQNKTLIKTLVIKSNYAPYAINKELIERLGEQAVDKFDLTSWKYYKNLAGEYHFTDTPMNVVSLDTRQEILFSVENLIRHTATAEAYQYGTRYYFMLLRQFPEQETLISGILTPANKERAIKATDGTILAYPSYLVEEYETTLIMELESFIKLFNSRWDVQAFALSDPYYPVVQKAILAMQLFLKLLNARNKRAHSFEAHSFHIKEYLASHQQLDRFYVYLTREQALWLVRNIRYIERIAGKSKTFNVLLENILNKRLIPVGDYSIRQLAEFDLENYPVLTARRKNIGITTKTVQEEYVPLESYYNKEQKTTYGNKRFFDLAEKEITHSLAVNPSSAIQTKNLESSMVDMSESVPDPLPIVVMRQLVAMAHDGLYNVAVNFQDPLTSKRWSLMTWDAIVYMLYLTYKSEGLPFDTLPTVCNLKYRLHPRPVVTDLTHLIEPSMEWMYEVAENLISAQPILTECHSVSMFYEMTFQIYKECLHHWYLLADTHDLYERGVMEQMILKLFGSQLRDFSKGENAEVWRVRNNLPEYNYTNEESQLLFKELFERATGYQIDETRNLRNIQKALIDLFETLSSYSIQFIREINDNELILTGMPSLRVGNIRSYIDDETKVKLGIHFWKPESLIKDKINIQSQLDESISAVHEMIFDSSYLVANTDIKVFSEENQRIMTFHKANYFDITIEIPDPVTNEIVVYVDPGLEDILTQEKIKQLQFVN